MKGFDGLSIKIKNGPLVILPFIKGRKCVLWSFLVEGLVQVTSVDLILDFLSWGVGRKAG